MIVHSIKAPYVAPVHMPHTGRGYMGNLERYWDKQRYTSWVEGPEVKQKFRKGQLVTLKSATTMDGRIPSMILEIVDIQEVPYMAPLCHYNDEPKCIFVRNLQYPTPMHINYAPKALRILSNEEIDAYVQHNKSSHGPVDDPSKRPVDSES